MCPEKAIDFDQKEERVDQKVGAIVVATGYDLFPKEQLGEYGYGQIKDVIDGLTFERMLSPGGRRRARSFVPPTARFPRRWSSSSVWPRETRIDICLTVHGSAVCTRRSMPRFTRRRFRTGNLMFFTWISARTARATRSFSRRPWRKRGSSISRAGFPESSRMTER